MYYAKVMQGKQFRGPSKLLTLSQPYKFTIGDLAISLSLLATHFTWRQI
jgi:hypothetical protein